MTKSIIVNLSFVYDPDAGEVRLVLSTIRDTQKSIVISKPPAWKGAPVANETRGTTEDGEPFTFHSRNCDGYYETGCDLGGQLYDLIKDRAANVL